MQYEVLEYFTDLQDNDYEYNVGDVYPHEGYTPTDKRINDLASGNNVRKHPIIKAIPEKAESAEIVETSAVEETAEEKPKKRRKRED